MGKYDELIGGGKLILDVEEILNEESAKKVDDRIKKQKAELEKPIEINVKSNKAENQLKALHKAAQKVKDDLQDAISSQKGFEEVNKLVTKYGHLKKQIGDIAPVVGKNNATLKESNKILKDTKKLVDQLTVSQDKLNKTSGKTRTSKVNTIGSPKEIEQAFDAVEDKIKDVKDTYETFSEVVEKTKRSILGTDFDDIFHTRTVEGYAASLEKVRGKMSEIKDAARDARREYEDIVNTMASYTGIQLGGKSDFQKAIKDAWKQGDHAMAAKLFDSYQKRFPKGAFKPENLFGAEWSNNFDKNLTEANARLALHRTQLQRTAEAYGTYSALMSLQGMERQLTDGYNRMLQESAEAEKVAAEQANMLADAQQRFATNDVVTAQKNLNAAIDEYNAKVSASNRLLEEKRRIEDLDNYENEPWFNDYEFPVNKIMEISQQFAAAEDAANLFKIALKEAVRVYRELGGDMKLPFGADLLKEIDIPVSVAPVIDAQKKIASYTESTRWSGIAEVPGIMSDEERQQLKENGLDLLERMENRRERLKNSLKPVEEMVSRISKNASIKGLDWDKMRQEAADAAKALSTMYDEGITDTEEYITLQYKLIHILDDMGKSYGGVKRSGAKDSTELRQWAMDGISQTTGYNIGASSAIDALWGQGKFSIFETSAKIKPMMELAGDLLNYQGVNFSGGFGAQYDKAELKRLKPTIEFLRENTQELQAAQQKMAETVKLITDLSNKYGTEKFTEIFGGTMDVFGGLNIDNAVEQYDALIAKEQAYIEHIERRQRTLQEFTQSNTELVGQYVGTDSYEAVFMQFNKLAQAVWELGLPLEDANKQLKEFIDGLGMEIPGALNELSIGEKLLELERLTGMSISKMLSSYDDLESGIKSKVNTLLQSLGLMNEQLQFTFEKAHGGNAKAILGPDFVILQKTIEASAEFTGDLISKLHEAKQAGISVVPVLERVVSTLANQSNLDDNQFIPGYEIQQRGYGDILHAESAVSSLNQALQENEVVLKASREQLTKFIEDWIALERQGIQIDPSKGGNFLYSLEHGFSFIDLTLQNAKGEAKDLQTIFNEITSMLANTKGLNVFGRDNNLGLSAAEIINKVSSVFEQLGLATSNELRSWMVDRYDGIGNIHGQIDVKDLDKQPQIAQQTTLQIEAQADAEQKVAEATQEQIKSAKERLAIERQVTAELEKHQDIAQQIMIVDSDDLSYESPYSADQIANFTNGTDINKILTRFGVPTDKKEPIIDQFNQWVSLIAEQRELESQGIESLEYDFSTMIDQAMSQLVDMIMKDGTTRQPIEKTLETFYEFIQDYKIKYSASDVSEFGSQWPAILRQFGTGKYGVLTQDKSAKSINDKWSELLEVFPQLFDSETINEKDQLIQFLDVVKAARAEHNNKSKTQPVDLPDYAKNNVMYDLSSTYGIISGNIETMVGGFDRATSEQEKLLSAAAITEQHLEGQSDAAKRFANTLSDIIDNEGASKEIEKLFEPDVKNMIDNIRSAAQEGKVEFLQNILDSEELTTALTGAFSDAYNNIGDYKFRGKYPFEHDGLNKATIHLISKDESKTLDYVLKLEDGLLKIDKAKQKIGTTKFNIEHEVNSANAEVDKLVAKLNGRQLDGLDNLRTLAKNIVDTESLAKFTDELDVISKKVATLSSKASSSKGFNPLTNSVYEMENASITVETYAKQLERLGDGDGVSKAAEQLDNMASAAERFKNATNQTEEEGAFADYQQAKSKYKAYYEYAQESKKSAEAEAKQVNTEEQKIQQYYQSILNTVNKINALDKEIEQAKGNNKTGAFSEFINKTQEEKAKLIGNVKATLSEVAGLFGDGMIGQDVSVGGAKFFSSEDTNNLNTFLQSAQVQTALAQGDVNKLSECLGQLSSAFANSEKIGAQASETIRSSIQKASEVGQKIFRFDELGNIAGSNGFNENIKLYDDALKSYQTLQLVMAQLSGKSETDWTAEEAAAVKLLSEEFVKLGTQIDAVKQKEDRFFSDKPVYSLDGLPSADWTSLGIDDVKKLGEAGSSTKEKLEGMAQAIAKNSNGAVVLTKNFTQGADGISKLDFSVFDQNTNSIRDFTAAMGAATNQFTVYETTVDKSVANITSARKQLDAAGDMLKTLDASGIDISADGAPAKVAQLIKLMNQLEASIEDGDQTMITKLTKDVKLAAGETDKLYKQMLQLDDAIASNKVQDLGKGDAGGNVYNQLVDATRNLVGTNQNATVEFGRFDAATNTLNASLVNANGTVENFKVSMNGLNGQMTAQQSGVSKLTSTWDTFKASISKAGKQLVTAFAGYNVFYKAISEVRKGVGYVKEIDLALTELKKVTDETEESYRQFLNTAASTAGKIGSTVSDFTEATSNFARLGYTMEESANMAETAIVYRNVADGLDTVEEATDSIISTMKAFGIESNNTMGIVDRFNEVGKYVAQVT